MTRNQPFSLASKRLTIGLLSIILAIAGLSGVVTPAQAATTHPEFVSANTTPDYVIFNSDSEHLKIVQKMDDPPDWNIYRAEARICTEKAAQSNGCNQPGDFSTAPSWLEYKGATQAAQNRYLTFEGNVPNTYAGDVNRHFSYYFVITYKPPSGPLQEVSGYTTYTYASGTYYYFPGVSMYGASRTTISGPAKIATGSALTLSGKLTCYGRVGFKAPDYGWVYVQFRLKGETDWNHMGGVSSYNRATGAWKYTNLAVGADGAWRAVGSGDRCISVTSTPLFVHAGDGPPPPSPPPPPVPGAPDLSVGETTSTTAALNWSPPSNTAGITGYRFGWTSSNGLPVPSWNDVYNTTVASPFVMTNLNPDTTYTMYVEAVTNKGPGERATVSVHTTEPVASPTKVLYLPGAPQFPKARPGKRKVLLTWATPAPLANTARVNAYQVYRPGFARVVGASVHGYVFKGLKKKRTYTFYVRAHNKDGWGPWTRGVRVRIRR